MRFYLKFVALAAAGTLLGSLLMNSLSPQSSAGYSLPTVPGRDVVERARASFRNGPKGDHERAGDGGEKKRIPRVIWQTMREVPSELPAHTQKFIQRNPTWEYIAMDNEDCQEFMEHFFGGTSVLWAYNQVSPRLGAMRADIWRYSVLYVYGGMYIDADSGFDYDLDSLVRPTDGFVYSQEPHLFMNRYRRDFFLGEDMPFNNLAFLKENDLPLNNYLQWMMFSEPGHIFMEETLRSLVRVIMILYMREEKEMFKADYNHSAMDLVLYSTGPQMMTVSFRKAVWDLHRSQRGKSAWGSREGLGMYRLYDKLPDFRGINAVFKEKGSDRKTVNYANQKGGVKDRVKHWNYEVEKRVVLRSYYGE